MKPRLISLKKRLDICYSMKSNRSAQQRKMSINHSLSLTPPIEHRIVILLSEELLVQMFVEFMNNYFR